MADFDEMKDKAEDFAEKAAETAGDLFDKAKDGASDLIDKAKESAPGIVAGAKEAIAGAKDFIEEKTGFDIDGDGKVGKGE